MKTLALFSLSLAVTLGMPPFAPGVEQTPVLTEQEQKPLLGDWVPAQGHVVVEDPAPQVRPGSGEHKEVLAPLSVDMKQSMVEQEIKVKPQVREEQEGQVKTEIKKEPDVKAEPDVKKDQEADVVPGVNLNPEVKAEIKTDVEPEVEMESELNDDPEFKVKSEVEPDVQEEFQVQMNLEAEIETSQEIKERLIDTEGKYEMVGEPIMELEPLDDDSMEPSEVEKSLRAAFQNQNPVNQPLSEDLLMSKMDYVLDEEPLMELELQHSMGLPETKDGPDGGAQIGVAPKREKQALMRQGVKNPEETRSSPSQDNQGRSHCPGVILEGKCYQFFKDQKTATDAEFFCQEHAPGGHLASITSQRIHREVMNMMLRQNGALTRSWIGGLRYLKTGRFIWLDGSYWSYSDWLSWEPNNTLGVEDCVEVLAHGNGKFNDFTCWVPQAFICSYPYQ